MPLWRYWAQGGSVLDAAGRTSSDSRMSDGGAGAIVGVVSMLSKSKQGRIVLLVASGYLGLQYLVDRTPNAVLFGLAATLLVLVVVVMHFRALRRRRKSRASTLQLLSFFGLMLLALFGALFVILKRKRPAELVGVPAAADLDHWADAGPRL